MFIFPKVRYHIGNNIDAQAELFIDYFLLDVK